MFITSRRRARANQAPESDTVNRLQLVDQSTCGAELGKVSLVLLPAGRSHTFQAGPYEAVSIIVAGHAETGDGVPLNTGGGISVPAGREFTVTTTGDRASVLTIEGLRPPTQAEISGSAHEPDGLESLTARVFDVDDVADRDSHNPARGFHHMRARLLVEGAAGGAGALLVGLGTFAPGEGCHDLHRHPNAEEFFYVWEGNGVHLGPDGSAHAVASGNLVYVSRGEWHGFRNTSDRPARAIFGYFGVGSLAGAGYELPDPAP